ncbi:MAG: hypothetical protein PHC61_05750 [Chitinivibrionales bacterium]|nr:hypothetical protein [Chitinivibrionales bacterium]
MLNPNAGKKAMIPINTASSASHSQTDKMAHQALESAKSASFAPPATSTTRSTTSGQGRGRRKSTSQKTIMKGVYFEPAVYQALVEMQDKGQNVSKFINRLVRQSLTI